MRSVCSGVHPIELSSTARGLRNSRTADRAVQRPVPGLPVEAGDLPGLPSADRRKCGRKAQTIGGRLRLLATRPAEGQHREGEGAGPEAAYHAQYDERARRQPWKVATVWPSLARWPAVPDPGRLDLRAMLRDGEERVASDRPDRLAHDVRRRHLADAGWARRRGTSHDVDDHGQR